MRRLLSALFALLVGASSLAYWQRPSSELFHFGWEYGNLAEGLLRGHGLADAMARDSGPSAWMPPLLPCLYAAVFKIWGIKTRAACLALLGLRSLSAGLCLYWVLGWFPGRARQLGATVLVVMGTFLDAQHQLADLNDVWWTQLWLCLALQLSLQPARPWLAAPLLLASPASSLSMLFGLLPDLGRRRRTAWLLVAWTALAGLGWGLRNQLALGHFYPVKSNFWFDFQLANQLDDDGLITLSTVDTFHPIKANQAQTRYVKLGEAEFLEQARSQAEQTNPHEWLRRVLRRGGNAFWCLQSEVDEGPALDLSPAQQEQFQKWGWLVVKEVGPLWLFLQRPLPQEPASRQQARQRYQLGLESGRACLWAYWFTLFPGLAALYLWFTDPRQRRLVACYLGFLLPYVLIQHYARYQVSTLFLQVTLEVSAWTTFWRDRVDVQEP